MAIDFDKEDLEKLPPAKRIAKIKELKAKLQKQVEEEATQLEETTKERIEEEQNELETLLHEHLEEERAAREDKKRRARRYIYRVQRVREEDQEEDKDIDEEKNEEEEVEAEVAGG